MQLKSFVLKTSTNFELCCNTWLPDSDKEIKGVVVLHHGIAEHSLRYDKLGYVFTDNGYIFTSYDMRGHGKTAENSEKNNTGKFGKIANKKGYKLVIQDLNDFIDYTKEQYPDKKIILLGHSFGSFVTQGYIEKYSNKIDGCIISSTAGQSKLKIKAGIFVCGLVKFFKGKNKSSKFLYNVAFGSYNNRISNPKNQFEWLSKNEMNIQMYIDDRWCGINLTASFFSDMMKLLNYVHKNRRIKKIRKDLPILIPYGTEDPVGYYGKTVKRLYKTYTKYNILNCTLKAFKNDRHEILNETDSDKVENTFLKWIDNTLTE